jgi:peptidoglycan/LPS O-acetylase OafA/YrhL
MEPTTVLVDFFFVLSGFVIARAYTDQLVAGTSLFTFMARRAGRLWPLHAATLAVLVALELVKLVAVRDAGFVPEHPAFTGARDPWAIITHLLMVQSFDIGRGLTWNFPNWSLSSEFWTYALFVVLVQATARNPLRRVAFCAALVIAIWLVISLGADKGMERTDIFGVLRCLMGFFTGVMAERLHRSRLGAALASGWAELPLAVLSVIVVVVVASVPEARLVSPAVFFFAVVAFAGDAGPVSRLLKSAPLQMLGRLSYSVYLNHAILVTYAIPRLYAETDPLFADEGPLHQCAVLLIYLVLLLAVSVATWRLIELPGQRLFERALSGGSVRKQIAMPAR